MQISVGIAAMMFNQTRNERTLTVQMKNWLPLVLGPAFAILTIPGPVCTTAGHSMYQKNAVSDALKAMKEQLRNRNVEVFTSSWQTIAWVMAHWIDWERGGGSQDNKFDYPE